jgi:hypothetical protein
MTMAVEVSTKPMPATKATAGGSPKSDADAGQQRAADEHLQPRPEPEDLRRRLHSRDGLHLQPDDEQEHHHAELGDVQDRLRVGEQPEPERPDDSSPAAR